MASTTEASAPSADPHALTEPTSCHRPKPRGGAARERAPGRHRTRGAVLLPPDGRKSPPPLPLRNAHCEGAPVSQRLPLPPIPVGMVLPSAHAASPLAAMAGARHADLGVRNYVHVYQWYHVSPPGETSLTHTTTWCGSSITAAHTTRKPAERNTIGDDNKFAAIATRRGRCNW